MKINRWALTLLLVAAGLLLNFNPAHETASASDLWVAPVANPQLVQSFRQSVSDWSSGHRGVDYIVNEDQMVFATHSGVVTFAGAVVNRSIVSIRHVNGLTTSYEPICPSVRLNTEVQTGQPIGQICKNENYLSHCGLRTCLHFSMRNTDGYLSPLIELGGLSPSRLKPWDGLTCNHLSNAQC
jgi:murein DD-endopeptidase MepM/ murein hydrolase activator NlpD